MRAGREEGARSAGKRVWEELRDSESGKGRSQELAVLPFLGTRELGEDGGSSRGKRSTPAPPLPCPLTA